MKTNILITGASGFVGKQALLALIKNEKFKLSALSRDLGKLKYLEGSNVALHEADITKPESLKELLRGKEIIVHCAALMSNFNAMSKKEFYETNVLGTRNLLDLYDRKALRQFIHISTVGVYGDSPSGSAPISEDKAYGKGLSVYEWSKKESELVVLRYAKAKGLPFTILRLSQMYGSLMYYGWPDTIRAIKEDRFFIPGDGKAGIHLLNVIDFVKALKLSIDNERAMNKIYNIAGPEALSLEEVFRLISEILGRKRPGKIPYEIVYLAALLLRFVPHGLKNDRLKLLTPRRVRFFATDHVYDISKAEIELGYNPDVSAKDGFSEMVSWCAKEGLI